MKKKLVTIDIEVLRNCFICVCKIYGEKQAYIFEISERKNDLVNFFNFIVRKEFILVGYNINGYDVLVIQHIINEAQRINDANTLNKTQIIYDASQKIINRKSIESKKFVSELKKKIYFETIDLMTMLFPPKKQCSLKELQVTLKFKNVYEFEIDWRYPIKIDRIDELTKYCVNDVLSTEMLLVKSFDKLALRKFIFNNYDVECYSLDPVKTGIKYLASKYCKKHNIDLGNFLFTKRPFYNINIKDILFDDHNFELKQLVDAVNYFKNNENPIVPKNDKTYINKRVQIGNTFFDLGCGGIHSVDKKGITEVQKGKKYIQSDIKSYYPSSIINNKIISSFLDESFLDIYLEMYNLKAESKESGDGLKEEFAKLVLNSYFGQLLNEFGPFFSPESFFKITINGQFRMLKLIEMLHFEGFEIVSANTDSIDVLMDESKYEKYLSICIKWEDMFLYKLDHKEVKKVIKNSCNDYIMLFSDNEIKVKGQTFKYKIELGKGYKYPIVKKAIVDYFLENKSVSETILNCNDILDFCMYEKTGKEYTVLYNDIKVQRTNRFFASKNGFYLYKTKTYYSDKKLKTVTDTEILINTRVSILNDFERKTPIDSYDVNYSWYIKQAETVINDILFANQTLF